MKSSLIKSITALLVLGLSGCSLPRSTLATRTTLGVELLSDPPSTTVAYTREEGAIAHTYEGGQTPPLIASFGMKQGAWPFRVSNRAASGFAGGAAAYSLALEKPLDRDAMTSPTNRGAIATASFTNFFQKAKGLFPAIASFIGIPDQRQVFFGTDTTYGLKAGISTVSLYPALKLGLNRREFASAPHEISRRDVNGTSSNYVETTPFLASFNNQVDVEGTAVTNHPVLRHLTAEEERSSRTNLVMANLRDPVALALKLTAFPDPVSHHIREWAKTGATVPWSSVTNWAGATPLRAMDDSVRTNLIVMLNGYLNAQGNIQDQGQVFAGVDKSSRTASVENWSAPQSREQRVLRSRLLDAYRQELQDPATDSPNSRLYLQQYFALGETAVELSRDPAIRAIVRSRLTPADTRQELAFAKLKLRVWDLVKQTTNQVLNTKEPADPHHKALCQILQSIKQFSPEEMRTPELHLLLADRLPEIQYSKTYGESGATDTLDKLERLLILLIKPRQPANQETTK